MDNDVLLTDTVGKDAPVKHKGGKGSKFRRTEEFRKKKNKETDAAIMAGIFARLKISDPTAVPALPLARDMHPVTTPVSFRVAPEFTDRVWDTMEAIGTRPFGALNTLENKNIFKKGVLILSEAKVCYAQRAHIDKPDEDLPSKKLYTLEELHDLNNMASILPYPLAIYLESIGNTSDNRQLITPLIAELDDPVDPALSGVISYAPRCLVPLLRILSAGVPLDGEVYQLAQAMETLPAISWEQFDGPPIPPAQPVRMVRLTDRCRNFWLHGEVGRETIKWTDEEYRIFVKIIQSLNSKKGFNIATDLSHGQGSLAQVVQVPAWNIGRSCEWFTMCDVSEYEQKLGVAFGFGFYCGNDVQPSRFTGSYTTSYWRGELTPRRVMQAIVAGQE